MIVPMFPLPGAYLIPGTIMPLHIFEPRYRKMTEDLLDTAGRLVIATIDQRHEGDLAGSPPVLPVAGLGEICGHEKLDDGRFVIALAGLGRTRLREIPSEEPYRMVELLPFEEQGLSDDEGLRRRLETLLKVRLPDEAELPEELPLAALADLLLAQLSLANKDLSTVFPEEDLARRIDLILHFAESSNDDGRASDSQDSAK